MLSLDMSLDTDLGIDSIKRVEILSALQERLPGAPTVNPEELGTFQFLENIVEFLVTAMPNMSAAPQTISQDVPTSQELASSNDSTLNIETLSNVLLEVVGDKTGYPMDMLSLEMSLDTDLGIDSIKRVEILSALQEKLPEAPMVSPEDLGNLQTLQQIVDFLAVGSTSAAEAPMTTATSVDDNQLADTMLEVVADKTGYPVDMLGLEMNLETDLGIDSIKRVEILSALQERLPEMPAVKPEDLGALQTLQQIVDHMLLNSSESPVATEPETTTQQITADVTAENTSSVERQVLSAVTLTEQQEEITLQENATVWVTIDKPALTQAIYKSLKKKGLNPKMVPLQAVPDEALAGLIILTPANPDQTFMKESFLLLQRVSASLRAAGKSNVAFLASVSQLGGQFGLNGLATGEDETCPVSGGIAGLVKTADKEWPEVKCKTIDIQINENIKELADKIVDECLLDGPLEVGLVKVNEAETERYTLELNTAAIDGNKISNTLDSNDVVVVTGGARGVTAEIALALAETYQTSLLLLGRSKQPGPEAEWLTGLSTEAEIKKAVLAKEGKGTTPKELNKACQKILMDREIRKNLQRIEATGVRVMYRAVDVQNKEDVVTAVNEARESLGTISGFVHGAGVLADKLIEDKTEQQFSQVYATKLPVLIPYSQQQKTMP